MPSTKKLFIFSKILFLLCYQAESAWPPMSGEEASSFHTSGKRRHQSPPTLQRSFDDTEQKRPKLLFQKSQVPDLRERVMHMLQKNLKDYPRDLPLLQEFETARLDRKVKKAKWRLVKKRISTKRLQECTAYSQELEPNPSVPLPRTDYYLNYEKWIQLSTTPLFLALPKLDSEEPYPPDLSDQIKTIYKFAIGEKSFFCEQRPGYQGCEPIIEFARLSGFYPHSKDVFEPTPTSSYAINQIGKRLQRFLTFFMAQLDVYKTLEKDEEKRSHKQKLDQLLQSLYNIEVACIDRSLSGLDEAEHLMLIFNHSVLSKPNQTLTPIQIKEKRKLLLKLAITSYKKYLIMALAQTAKRQNFTESVEAYLGYTMLVQQSLNLGQVFNGMRYDGFFKQNYEIPFTQIIDHVVQEMSLEGFLYFISATTAIPDEIRQWTYQALVGHTTNFTEEFEDHYALWEEGKATIWKNIEKGKETNPFFLSFYDAVVGGSDITLAYDKIFSQKVRQQALDDLKEEGYVLSSPFYLESFSVRF